MNTQTLKGNWNVTKGKLKQKYAQLTDNDLEYAEGREDELIGRIQKKVGASRDEIERFLDASSNPSDSTAEQRRGAAEREAHVDRPLRRAPTNEGKAPVDARTPQPQSNQSIQSGQPGERRNIVAESRREGDLAQQSANAVASAQPAGQQNVAQARAQNDFRQEQAGASRPTDNRPQAGGNPSGSNQAGTPGNQNRNGGAGPQSGSSASAASKPGDKRVGSGGNS